jgi:photosystem II stability/assembly factor-like uncharacterized protein
MRKPLIVTFLTLTALTARAADSPTPTDKPEDRWFKGMKYRLIGPFRGGRSLTVTGIPGDPNTYYFGGVGGGVWKSTDGATTWSPIFDKEGTSAIGSIAVAPSDPNVLYVGTGETCLRGNISHGDGVYKSLDAGKTWKNVGLRDTRAVGAVIVHPRNPDIVFVAALGHPYGPNSERGVFRTTDGGKTWEKVLYKDENTGAVDVVFDPNNPNILFAALWQVHRTPYSLDSGGPGSGLYRSGDGGATWKLLDGEGLPKPPYGKIGVAVSADSDRIYALIEAAEGGLYRSDDGGEKWQLVNPSRSLYQRAWYYMHVTADPKDPNTLYIQDVQSFKSTDGGHSFNKVKVPHGDNHALWIDPMNTRRMILGNDGGAAVSLDGGKSWSTQNNQPTSSPITRFPIVSTVRSRTTLQSPSRAAATGALSIGPIGIPSGAARPATSPLTRPIPTSFMLAITKARSRATIATPAKSSPLRRGLKSATAKEPPSSNIASSGLRPRSSLQTIPTFSITVANASLKHPMAACTGKPSVPI